MDDIQEIKATTEAATPAFVPHYFSIIRSRTGGHWFTHSSTGIDPRDKAAVIQDVRNYWKSEWYEIVILSAELPVGR